jgi:2-haloacid dehalogenase
MTVTLAFDVYGTLIDTHGVVSMLRATIGDKADEFSRLWRDKQLEYSFRRGLMQNYENFAVCTKHALDYACAFFEAPLTGEQKDELLGRYRTLPAFDDVTEGLAALKAGDFRAFAFSNGSAEAVETLLQHAGIRRHFVGVVSVDDVKSFKPNPAVYAHFLRCAGAGSGDAWMVSSNPFDIIGAMSAGMKAAWVRRSPKAVFDPWGIEPTLTVTDLRDLGGRISRHEQR